MTMTIPDDLDEPRQLMYEELTSQHGTDAINADLRAVVHQRVTELYDNREEL